MSKQPSQRSVLHQILSVLTRKAPGQLKQQVQPLQRPAPGDRDAWHAYWEAQGQPWRTEPEIDRKRQVELTRCRATAPNIEKGTYPFKGMHLSRADVEWLLATHEEGLGPVDWNDESQREREGLDLRGADLQQEDLSRLPLSRMRGGLAWEEWPGERKEQLSVAAVLMKGVDLTEAELQGAALRQAGLQGAILKQANLQKAFLLQAQLQGADLLDAHLEGANLCLADLQGVDLFGGQLQGANLNQADLQSAGLSETQLQGADLRDAHLEDASLNQITLSDEEYGTARLADVNWGNANLAVVEWEQVKRLGDEEIAHQKKDSEGKTKDKQERLSEYKEAARANRQLAVVLQSQGLNEDAVRFAYRAQLLQRRTFWFEMVRQKVKLRQRGQAMRAWLFSWFLYLLAGYGYKPERSFLAYLFVIIGFATSYYLLGLHDVVGPYHVFGPYHLTWYEAIVVSMTAFHGRGFFANQFQPGDPQAFVAAFEAFVGLLIEVTFIATLTRRLFGQ
jgi:uncharacterized protein YjbI with pentapeptide repeats